ncbi:MAG TPA: hypothetical protein VKA90_02650 [Beijerinckiaceae bacterium]|nr:hypothetical protein [Beijerinckiaceae bacterium]
MAASPSVHCAKKPARFYSQVNAETVANRLSTTKNEGGVEMAERMEDVADRSIAANDETKWGPLTTEFWVMAVLEAAILIAAAISDSLNDVRAWTLVAGVGAAYILSRGIAKAGTDHSPRGTARRRRS